MEFFNANLLIRESRKAQGLTQEQLAEGICTRETVVKLEKNKRKPSWFVYKEIMQRLGLESEIYQNKMVSNEEIHVMHQYNKCEQLIGAREFAKAKALIDEMEEERNTNKELLWYNGQAYYLLLFLKAGLYSLDTLEPGGNPFSNTSLGIQCALEALRITRPDFDVNQIKDYFLASHEFRLINTIAVAHITAGDNGSALELLNELKENTKRNYSVNTKSLTPRWHAILQSNITAMFLELERYEECLAAAEEGLQNIMSPDNYHMIQIHNYLICKAISLTRLGCIVEGKEEYKKVLFIVYILDGRSSMSFKQSKERCEELFGEKLDLSLQW